MMIHHSFKLTLISFSAFILAEITPSQVSAMRGGFLELVGAVTHAGVAQRFMATAKRGVPAAAAALSERPKSPVRRGRKPSPPQREVQDGSQLKLPEGLLSLKERAALIKICRENCAPTLASLDDTVEALRHSPSKLGRAAQIAIDLSQFIQEQHNDPRQFLAFRHDREIGERFFDLAGVWRESVSAARATILSLPPSAPAKASFDRINKMVADLYAAFGASYKSPL